MKKKKLKGFGLNKKRVSELNKSTQEMVKGGTGYGSATCQWDTIWFCGPSGCIQTCSC